MSFRSDHPRACGANSVSVEPMSFRSGSSPRVRGKRSGLVSVLVGVRIIPARAGQTLCLDFTADDAQDHPRACGANAALFCVLYSCCGSSPRVRGKLGARSGQPAWSRIIPARAGQTRSPVPERQVLTDHPRACGANPSGSTPTPDQDGSSPRVRGKHWLSQMGTHSLRIIPARAGQTVRFYAKTLERWTLNNWIRTVAPIFVLLFLLPVIGQNAYIERHYSNQSFSWFSKLHYASAFDLSLVA